MASTSLPSDAPLSPSLRRPAKLSGAYAYASTQARSGWRKVSANALRRRSMSAVRFADEDGQQQQRDDMPPPAKIPRRSQASRPSLGGLVQPPPTLAVRCQALAANALAVLSFYAQLADEDFDERNWLSHNTLAHMRRSWEPFDSYKTNQLLESAQYHHHFIDADEVARSLVDARRLREHGSPLGFRETMLIANCATFLHYVWSLPTSPLPASSSVGVWPCRNVAELQDAWRVFLRHIVPQDRPLDDDILALHLELSTQVYIARLAQLLARGNQDQAQIEAEADAELEELLGPDSLARDIKRKIQNRWLALANARSQELESILYDVEACRSTFPISQLAVNMTALVLDIVSQVEAQIRDYQEPHLLGSLFAPAMPAAQPPPRRVSLPRNEPPVLPAGFYQPQDIQREAWLRELLESQSADSSANMSGVTGWGAASQADSASDYLDARDRMEIFKGLLADERAFPGATVRQSSRSQSRSFGASPLIPRGSMRAASAFSVSTSVAMREYDQQSRQASTSGHRSRRSLSGFHVPEAITEGSGEEREPSVSTQIRQEAMRELEARPPPPSSPPRGPFAASIQQQRRRSSAQQAGPSRSPPRPPPRSPAAGIQVRQGHLVRGPAPASSRFHDREAVGERMTRFDSQDEEDDGQESEDIFLERQRAKQRLNQRDQGRATYKKGRRAAAAPTPAGPVRWPKPPREPMPFSVAVPPLAEATASSSLSSPSSSRRRSTRPPSEGLPAARASEVAPHVQTTTTAAGATVITATTISDADRARLEEWREQTLRNADKDAEGGFEGDADETIIALREQLTLEYWFSRIRPGLENLPEPRPQLNLQAAVAAAVEEKQKGRNLARIAVLQPHLLPSDGERDEQEEGAGEEDGAQDVAEPSDEERDEEREEEEQVATQLSAPPSCARSASARASSDDTDSDDEINAPDDDDDDDDFRPSGSRSRRGRAKKKKQQKKSQQKSSQQQKKSKASSRPPRSQTSVRATASQASQPPSSSQKRNNAAWTDEERETFLASMYQLARYKEVDPHYQVYAQILSRHGRTGSESRILARRSNADLKTQARVELWRLKDEGELIPYWKRLLMPRVFLDARPRATRQVAEPIVISDVSEGEEEREEAGEMEEQAQGEAAEQGEDGLQQGQSEEQPGHSEEQQGEAMAEAEVAAAVAAAAAAAGAGAAPSMEVQDENAAVEPYDLDGGADFGVQEPVNFEEYLVEDAERNEGEQGEAAQEEGAEDVEADEEAAEKESIEDGEASGEEEQAPRVEAPDGRPASDVGLLLAFDSSGQTSPLSSVPPEEPSARFVDEPLTSEGSPRRSQRSRRVARTGYEEVGAPKQASKGLRKPDLASVDPSSSSSSPRRIGPSTSSTTPLPATRSATATTTLRRGRSRKG